MEQTTDQFFFHQPYFLGIDQVLMFEKSICCYKFSGDGFCLWSISMWLDTSFRVFCSIYAFSYAQLNIPILKYEKGTKTANNTIHALSRHSTSYQVLKCKQAFAFFPHTIFIQPFSGMTDLNMHLSWALMPSYFSHLQNIQTFFFSLSAYRAYVNKQLPTLIVHFWLNSFF